MTTYRNCIALVTGGASGIGEALCIALAQQGAHVVVTDINADDIPTVVDTIRERNGSARGVPLDVTHAAAFEAVVADIFQVEGKLDYIFNNAGIGIGGEVQDMTLAHWDQIIDVNIKGVIHGITAAYPRMIDQGSGHIVNIASMAGLVPSPGAAAYCMTKHAVLGLSTSLRGEGEALGVKVTAVCPGFVQSQIYTRSIALNLDREKLLAQPMLKALTPASTCARKILKGVAKNRSIVTVTAHAWWGWRLFRLLPGLFNSWLGPLGMKMTRERFRLDTEPRADPGSSNETESL